MEVRMEHTEGLGRLAEVLVDGHTFYVCDAVSDPGRPASAGLLEEVEFCYMTAEGFSWDEAARGNPSKERRLDHVRGWAYQGYGRVVSIMPVRVDFGLLEMEDANWSRQESLVGRFVTISIDRLELRRKDRGDWPAHLR